MACERHNGRRLSGTIRADERKDFASRGVEGEIMYRHNIPVPALNISHTKHQAAPSPR
jgi:hypothetical protein